MLDINPIKDSKFRKSEIRRIGVCLKSFKGQNCILLENWLKHKDTVTDVQTNRLLTTSKWPNKSHLTVFILIWMLVLTVNVQQNRNQIKPLRKI